jgi:hypothetical protein
VGCGVGDLINFVPSETTTSEVSVILGFTDFFIQFTLVRLLDAILPPGHIAETCCVFTHTRFTGYKRHIPEISTELATIVDTQIHKSYYGDDGQKISLLVCTLERQLLVIFHIVFFWLLQHIAEKRPNSQCTIHLCIVHPKYSE